MEKVLDGTIAGYLNFDTRLPEPVRPSGFVVTPFLGRKIVTGMRVQSAGEVPDVPPERDPKVIILSGSDSPVITQASFWEDSMWTEIATIVLPDFTSRGQWQEVYFPNQTAYTHYRWMVTETRIPNGCCMEVAEVELIPEPSIVVLAVLGGAGLFLNQRIIKLRGNRAISA